MEGSLDKAVFLRVLVNGVCYKKKTYDVIRIANYIQSAQLNNELFKWLTTTS